MLRGGRVEQAGASIQQRRARGSPLEVVRASARPPGVAMLASASSPSVGGIPSQALCLGQKLVALGADVHVVTPIQPGLAAFERMAGVRVHRVGCAAAKGAAGSAAFVADAVRLLARLGRQVDVLHAHQLLSPTTVGLLAAPLLRLPLVLSPHACGAVGEVGLLSATRIGRLRLRAATRADAFVAASSAIRDELIAVGVPPSAIARIGDGVDVDRFSPASAAERRCIRSVLGLDTDAPLVACAGAPQNGVDALLDAWPRVVARVAGARLLLLGDGAEERSLRARARTRGVEASLCFARAAEDVAPGLRAADAAVLPSGAEGMPVALLEAMSCALPVVATRVAGSAEALQDGVAGRLVPPAHPDALADALVEALLDRAAAVRRGEAARAHVVAHHALALVARQVLDLYGGLTRRR